MASQSEISAFMESSSTVMRLLRDRTRFSEDDEQALGFMIRNLHIELWNWIAWKDKADYDESVVTG